MPAREEVTPVPAADRPDTTAAVIRVERFSKAYEARLAVDDVSFAVMGGDIVGLVGPNGAGKTTTLRTIAGILAPTGGSISVAGFDLAREPIEAKRRLAIVPDEPNLFAGLTVWEHLEFTARVYGVADFAAKARELLDELEMLERRHAMADELSRGMRQKTALACALIHDPQALLMDEPLTGLDPRGIRTLYAALRRRAETGAAIVLSTHLLGQIETLCTTFLILHAGRLVLGGTMAEIRAKLPALAADASLEDVFFQAVDGAPHGEIGPGA